MFDFRNDRKFAGIWLGATVWNTVGGAVFPQRILSFHPLPAIFPTTDVFVFPDLYDPWDAEGPAELLCWADGHSLSCVFADVFCGSPSVSHYLNDRWGCARKQELCIRCRSFPCDLSY